jgi:glycosyltransferase involved in cell wall biosynthesis
MKVSIITVARNSASTISATIDSVLAQQHSEIEYIIVDGASVDGTQEVVERYGARISRFISEPDRGIYDAMNKGLTLASGDVIGILNSDDEYADDRVLTDVVRRLEDSGADGVYGDLVYVDRIDTSRVLRRWKAGDYRYGAFKWGWMPPHPTFFVRRVIYERFGCFTSDFRTAADYELMLRFIHRYKRPVTYLPRVVTRMRAGGASNFSMLQRIEAYREDHRAWCENQLSPGFTTLLLKRLRKISQFL